MQFWITFLRYLYMKYVWFDIESIFKQWLLKLKMQMYIHVYNWPTEYPKLQDQMVVWILSLIHLKTIAFLCEFSKQRIAHHWYRGLYAVEV